MALVVEKIEFLSICGKNGPLTRWKSHRMKLKLFNKIFEVVIGSPIELNEARIVGVKSLFLAIENI